MTAASLLPLPIMRASVLPTRAVGAGMIVVSSAGCDTNEGSWDAPLRTISAAAQAAQPGDLVVVESGLYTEGVTLPRSGTPGAVITFRALPGAVMYSPNPDRSVSAFDVGANAYIVIEGFELTGGFDETVYVRPGAHDIGLSGLYVHENHSGIWIAGASAVTVRGCVIEHNVRT